MKILGAKEGHDGAIALLDGTRLVFSLEAEKDSSPRCTQVTVDLLLRSAQILDGPPDVIAVGGWTKGLFSSDPAMHAGYFGSQQSATVVSEIELFGRQTTFFSSSHERGHILSARALSPLPAEQPFYCLVWEGNIGNFYFVDGPSITDIGCALPDPGNKYTFLYSLADIRSPDAVGFYDTSHPGKMMALAAYGSPGPMTAREEALAASILGQPRFAMMSTLSKSDYRDSGFFNVGVESAAFKDLARRFSDRLFQIFLDFAAERTAPGLPLLISGGCGLNCEWNSKWESSGLFSEVFVPPCTNDSGSAIGVAADALYHLTGEVKLEWTAYCGEVFIWDAEPSEAGFSRHPFDPDLIAKRLAQGEVFAWVEGKYEMGPRALGHRSIIAEPFNKETRDRLNTIKLRESFRPIAPICLAESMGRHFLPDRPSPHMLYFFEVTDSRLKAITHVDGSARVQTLEGPAAPYLAKVLHRFDTLTGAAVLCNTSLNLNGRGFINRMSDLLQFSVDKALDGFVVDGAVFFPSTG